jgi:hypothetical protein
LSFWWCPLWTIRPASIANSLCISALTWFIRYMYIYFWNIQSLDNVNINANFRILHSSCNVKKPKTNVKFSKRSRNKHRTFPLKLVQINFIFSDNVRILYIFMMTRQTYVWMRYRWKYMHSIRPASIANSLITWLCNKNIDI